MTKLAIERRQDIRAMRTLVACYGYEKSDFDFETAEERGGERLKGSPILWHRCSYEYDEWDEERPLHRLRTLRAIDKTDWERVAREDAIRCRYTELLRLRMLEAA